MKRQKKTVLKGIMATGTALCMSVVLCMIGYAKGLETESMRVAPIAANAGEAEITPMAVGVTMAATLNISSGTATASCKVSGASKKVTKISVTMYLQKKSSKGTYSTIKTWNGSKNGYYYNMKKTCSVSKGTYRVKAKITSYTGNKSETAVRYSSARTYR